MRQDKISGASEIESKAMKFVLKYAERKELFDRCLDMLKAYPSMGSLWNIANFAFLYGKEAEKKFEEMKDANKKLIRKASSIIEDGAIIATYSRSSTVLRIFEGCREKKIRIMCSESRPRYEGRKLAKELCNDFEIFFSTDVSLFSMIENADLILIGADAITENNVVNKIGTSVLASYAMQLDKPLYVATTSYKAFPYVFIKEEDRKEIWRNAPCSIKIRNFYFDATPVNKITYFITEKGVQREKPPFPEDISKEVDKISKILSRKYQRVR